MKNKYLEILKKSYYHLNEQDLKKFEEIMGEKGLGKCRAKFHLWGFLFGWFYLLYRKALNEAFGVLVVSLMVGYVSPVGVLIVNSLLGGFCYYYLYLNKLDRDIQNCGGIYNPNIECIKKKAKPNIWYVVSAVAVILILIWPIVFSLITGHNISK
jgi:hypothetical protein